MTKKDEDNPDYTSIILCSKGLGANYAKENQLKHRWNGEKTIITYKTHSGQDLPLPRYYKTTIYTDDQRQLLWLYASVYRDWETDRKSTRLNSSHITRSRMPSSA